ncbi:hypothetical protein Dimus_014357 [Dionaea muscipula]
MGFVILVFPAGTSSGYSRLSNPDDLKESCRPRRQWVKRTRKRTGGIKLSRCRKLSWKAISWTMLPRRIGRICADIVNVLSLEGGRVNIPSITNWGLPVLSHGSIKCRKTAVISYHGSILYV